MKRTNNESGLLVVEASLALFFLMFFMLFIWNFAGVFTAQNVVSHAAHQTVQTIAIDNISREKGSAQNAESQEFLNTANKIIRFFNGSQINLLNPFYAYAGDKTQEVKNIFFYIIDSENGEKRARSYGIDVNNMEFIVDEAALGPGARTVRIKINYTVKLRFGVFGIDKMNLTKCAECKLFGADTKDAV